jgi:hypothetical protein
VCHTALVLPPLPLVLLLQDYFLRTWFSCYLYGQLSWVQLARMQVSTAQTHERGGMQLVRLQCPYVVCLQQCCSCHMRTNCSALQCQCRLMTDWVDLNAACWCAAFAYAVMPCCTASEVPFLVLLQVLMLPYYPVPFVFFKEVAAQVAAQLAQRAANEDNAEGDDHTNDNGDEQLD